MMKIKTKTGKEFNAKWAGVSTIDNNLRFAVTGVDMLSAVVVFSDPEETKEITFELDETKTEVYENYTELKGLDFRGEETTVTLKEGEENADTY